MPTAPAPGIAEVALHFTQDLQLVENIFHVRTTGVWEPATLLTLAEDVATWWLNDLKPQCADNLVFREVVATDLSTGTGAQVTHSISPPQTGTGGSGALPNSATLAVKWTTGLRGRSFRGRTYHLGLLDAQVASNTVIPATLASLITDYNGLINAINLVTERTMVVLSRFTGGVERPIAIGTPIIQASIDPTVDSQRRRLPGRGR